MRARFGIKKNVVESSKPTIFRRTLNSIKKNSKTIMAGGAVVGSVALAYAGYKYKLHTKLPKINFSRLWRKGEKIPTKADNEYNKQVEYLEQQIKDAEQSGDRYQINDLKLELQNFKKEYNNQKSLFNRLNRTFDKINETKAQAESFYYKLPDPLKTVFDKTQADLLKKGSDLMESMTKSEEEINDSEQFLKSKEYENFDDEQKEVFGANLKTLKNKRKQQEAISKEIDELVEMLNSGSFEEQRTEITNKLNELDEELASLEQTQTQFGKSRSRFGKSKSKSKSKKPKKISRLKNDLKRLNNC